MAKQLVEMEAPVQGARRCDPPAHSRVAADRRGLRLRHPREPEDSAAEGVAPSGVSAPGGPGRDAARRAVGPLPARERSPIRSWPRSATPFATRSRTSTPCIATASACRSGPAAVCRPPVMWPACRAARHGRFRSRRVDERATQIEAARSRRCRGGTSAARAASLAARWPSKPSRDDARRAPGRRRRRQRRARGLSGWGAAAVRRRRARGAGARPRSRVDGRRDSPRAGSAASPPSIS